MANRLPGMEDAQVESLEKLAQLKISHYNIKIDRSYGQGLAAGA